VVAENAGNAAQTTAVVVPQSVLIIRQTRQVHEEIAKVIQRVENGDAAEPAYAAPGFGGGGGFGGGLLSK
jgi:hypothetical protein